MAWPWLSLASSCCCQARCISVKSWQKKFNNSGCCYKCDITRKCLHLNFLQEEKPIRDFNHSCMAYTSSIPITSRGEISCNCSSSTTVYTQPPTVECKMEVQLEYIHIACTFFARLALICMLSQCLLKNKIALEVSRKLTKIALLVGHKKRPNFKTLIEFRTSSTLGGGGVH